MKVTAAISLALQLLESAARVSAAVRAAQARGADELSVDEWREILTDNDTARTALIDAIARKSA